MFSFVCLKYPRKWTTWRKPTAVLSTNQYILSYTQYTAHYTRIYHLIHVHTGTSPYIQVWLCISQYILAWTRIYWYKTVYTRKNTVYLCKSPDIPIYTRMKHFAKRCMIQGFEPLILLCILQGCSYHCATSVDISAVHLMILVRQIEIWGCSCTSPAGWPGVSYLGQSQTNPSCWHCFDAGFQVSTAWAGAARLPMSAMLSAWALRVYLSPSHYMQLLGKITETIHSHANVHEP